MRSLILFSSSTTRMREVVDGAVVLFAIWGAVWGAIWNAVVMAAIFSLILGVS